ncbi:hypothetical protein LPJ53_004828 [Coemansia erecta]|uniref:TPR-like protein n=1 Tax=Coemansia erecta TaxID=147472 RepID=A0A9W8CPE3_9FUNG|nr:hypothetical protein LPJ53_004828 [Coemansia erecta]
MFALVSARRTLAAGLSRRRISSFHIDNSARGKMQPYIGAIKAVSLVAGLVTVSIGGLYLATNHHLDTTYPVPSTIRRKETRRLLRGAALREHIAPNPQVAYMFLLRALEQIYADGELAEDTPEVQAIIVRLATAASLMGERKPAQAMLEGAWPHAVRSGDTERICTVAEVLGPLLREDGSFDRALEVYGEALRAGRQMDEASSGDAQKQDAVRARVAGLVASLGETFALKGEKDNARVVLEGLLEEIRERGEGKQVDQWTCLDAVVMLDLAQVAENARDARAWANSAVERAQRNAGVKACDNCHVHGVFQLGQLLAADGDTEGALRMYKSALELGRRTGTGNIERIKESIEQA